ncbi:MULTISPECIES: sulfurtransferase [unclassified Chelatococcus]|uniref:sulfurtransferase n=1 Tax=unclassified Chelatococcus TaxID=2638111 RepID=UPI001BCAEF78|nr:MULTISPECIES: sulfurtransferase [unclassified Chelatococcus]MBS7696702.1 sulfurtransferase [Chelatococcus sp. YT9]MBX3555267.1 sulfurtransferase [Chelatococcus sp.]
MTDSELRSAVFISADELHAKIAAGTPPVLLDIRFRHAQHDRRFAYEEGHIPGAIYVDLQHELAGEPGGTRGNRPLPELADLQKRVTAWGIHADSEVVVYDDHTCLQAGRGWWTLKWGGLPAVRLLDGGLDAWIAAGYIVTKETPTSPAPGTARLTGGGLPTITADEAAQMAIEAILLDSRGTENYRGGPTPPGQPPRGHIPGAINAPTPDNLDARGLTLPTAALRQRFAAFGVDGSRPLGVYCGGGVSAAHQIAVLTSIGIRAALFPGSWSAWSGDPDRPVARGELPWGEDASEHSKEGHRR